MARQLVIHITCGICEEPIGEGDEAYDRPLRFAWEGRGWEVDLCAAHLAAITEAVGPYMAAAVPAGQLGPTPATTARKAPAQRRAPRAPVPTTSPIGGWLCPECGQLIRGASNRTRKHLTTDHRLSAAEALRRLPKGRPGTTYATSHPELAHLIVRVGDPRLG